MNDEWLRTTLHLNWTYIKLCNFSDFLAVRTLYVSDRSLYSMHSLISSHLRDLRIRVKWDKFRSYVHGNHGTYKRVLDLLKEFILKLRKTVQQFTAVKFWMNSEGIATILNTDCFRIKLRWCCWQKFTVHTDKQTNKQTTNDNNIIWYI